MFASIDKILKYQLFNIDNYKITIFTLLSILLIYILTKICLYLIKKTLFRKHKFVKTDEGNTYALFQIIKYVVWIMSIGLMLEAIHIKVTVLIAGSAALLVGVGLGLQQTFNDMISGIILLSERSIKINDILEIDGDIIKIQSIGLRTSKGLDRDEISIIIPNSLITTNKVINWSHQSKKTRFRIPVGVAYGSDVDLILKTLEESAFEHPDIYERQSIEARLVNFGASSLDFELLFFSKNIFRIGKVKSDIRLIINKKFIENNITIPFNQLDVHLKKEI
ncbi:mechanosensitive ion channel family protein [Labilibaculum euxinus]